MRIRLIILGLGLVTILIVTACSGSSPSVNLSQDFEELPIDIVGFGMDDLGIADVNNDSLLDIFTSNFAGPQSLLINQGMGQFKDEFSALKLDQDHAFPGLAVLPKEPPVEQPGLYINWRGPALLVRAYRVNRTDSISGVIELSSPVTIAGKEHFDVMVKQHKLATGVTQSIIEFKGKQEGFFSVKPYLLSLPIKFHLDSESLHNQTYVGPDYTSPSSSDFSMNLVDRHGMAWADYNDDGLPDVYITRGGLKGWIGRMPGAFWDELFIGGSDGFRNIGQEMGFVKYDCPGRQVAWVDYNGDSRLDLYVSCASRGKVHHKNRLYEQTPDGHFINVARKAGLDIGLDGTYVWLDVDADGDPDFFWADKQAFYLYVNEAGKFKPTRLGPNPAGRISKKLTVSDFDSDGDFDIFAAAPAANALCINTGGSYVIADPTRWGLPGKSWAANWVDYDNDGLQDLHAIPNGLYQQHSGGKFKRNSVLDVTATRFSSSRLNDARVSWFDLDNDGARDLILALKYRIKNRWWANWFARFDGTSSRLGGLKEYWNVALIRNKPSANHWIQIRLVGPPGNRPAIGSKVTVMTSSSRQVQYVGTAEGSRYSQGHYRLYFGLGQYAEPVTMKILWPDGHNQEIKDIDHDRLLVVKHEK